jgi:hypothetical protein
MTAPLSSSLRPSRALPSKVRAHGVAAFIPALDVRLAVALTAGIVGAIGSAGCSEDRGEANDTLGSGTSATATASGTTGTGTGSTSLSTSSTDTSSTLPTSSGSSDTMTRFDVTMSGSTSATSGADDGSNVKGCKGIDFLFVIDNSGSMAEEQSALIGAFPGFAQAMADKVAETDANNFHIMVVDSDAASVAIDPGCTFACFLPDPVTGLPPEICPLTGEFCVKSNPFCQASCDLNPQAVCCTQADPMGGGCIGQEIACEELSGCAMGDCSCELGGGKLVDSDNISCGVTGGQSYIQAGQPDLPGTFACLANVGTSGSGSELMMQAMTTAVGPLAGPGQCNDTFLRSDAILVVTFITDEEDVGSAGDPNSWKQTLVAAKGGDENAVVVLGLIGVNDAQNSACVGNNAEAAPRLESFARSFPAGIVGSVCGSQQYYVDFFQQAVNTISSSCDDFIPPG